AGDDPRVVRRMCDDPPLSLGDALHDRHRLVVVAPVFDNGGTERADRGVLVRIVSRWYADGRRDAEPAGAVRDPLPVVAGRCRDYAAPPFLGVQRGHEREAIPDLE